MNISVALADDQPLVRMGLRVLIESEDDLVVAGEAEDWQAAVDLVRRTRPDVILMDIRMPRLDGIAALRMIVSDPTLAGVRVIMLTTFELDEYVFEALQAGAAGFLIKDTEPADMLRAIRLVAAGESLLSPSVTRRVIDSFFLTEKVEPIVMMDTENVEIIKAMVKTGIGIGIVPYQAIAREVRAGQFFCARIDGHELLRETGWVYARANRVPRMIHELQTAFDEIKGRLQLAPGK